MATGCGSDSSSSSSSSSSSIPASPAASTGRPASSADTVAFVASTPIPKASYEHWLAIEKALGGNGNPGHAALGFLLTSQWVIGEARARGISVSEADIRQHLSHLETIGFPKAGALKRFLATSGETEGDLLARSKVELLRARISAQVVANKSAPQRGALLASFGHAFDQHWKSYTRCDSHYVMEDCSEYKGPKTSSTIEAPPAGSPASQPSTSREASKSRTSTSSLFAVSPKTGASLANGEVASRPAGQLSLSSPAFGRNQEVPTPYTCDGTGISPPLQWTNVPAKAAALVLFIIDDDTQLPHGGIRWIVGNIDPHSSGVAAGATPTGGIVGVNAEGHTGYGSICPAHAHVTRIEFILYALSRKIALSPGFPASLAENEYGPPNNLVIGESGITYAGYQRP